jgi:hypothetical protein
MAQIEREQTVLHILQNLRDLGGLKKLFWEELNYERENEPLSMRGWPDSVRKTLVDDPILFASGGAWAMPYSDERIYYGRVKAQQIRDTGAKLVVAPCHNCRDQIMKSLTKEYGLDIETKYLWELVADSLIVEPWSEEEVEKAHALRDAQYERDEIVFDEEEEEEE